MSAFAGLIACGDDDTATTPGADAGTDTSVTTPDTGAGMIPDAGSDVAVGEAPDAAAVSSFRAKIDSALCSTVTRCCFNDPNLADGGAVTGGHYNAASCSASVDPLGFENSNVGLDAVDQTKLSVDPTKAVDCLSKINALTCDLPGAELAAARAACFGAVIGTTPNGGACTASMACLTGSYCKPTETDGSFAGMCAPLAGANGLCATFPFAGTVGTDAEIANAKKSEEACSTRGGGDTALHCNSYNPDLVSPPEGQPGYNPNLYRPRADWKCVPTEAIGNGCNSTVWCANGLCDPSNNNFVCTTPLQYFQTSGACTAVVTPSP